MKIELKCKCCETLFITDFKFRNKQFCNKDCYFEYARKNKLLGREKDETIRETRKCIQCGKDFTSKIKYQKKLCSDECRLLWNQIPKNKENRINKSKDALLNKYGVESFFDTENFKKEYKNIFNLKYGASTPMLVPEFVEKLQKSIRDRHLLNLLPKLNENSLQLLDDYSTNKNKNKTIFYNFKCTKCDNIFSSTLLGSGKIPICRKCFPITKNSKLEKIVRDFLNDNNVKHIDSNRTLLNGREIDIFLPDFGIGIEINGNYFHSELSGEKDKKYHISKSEESIQKNIKLLQIFEDELLLKEDIVFSRLSSHLHINKKIFARKCEIKEVTKKDAKLFINKNHIQGDTIDKYRYGLYHDNAMVAIMTFGHKRKALGNNKIENNEYELVRYSNLLNTNVIGGFSKLLMFFIKKHSPSKIETYADIRWSGLNPEKTVYYKNNFRHVGNTPPNYWYIDTKNYLYRHHRFNFRKDILVNEGFSKNKTEWEIMIEKKYDRIWDCGSMKFELNII